jgi:hypothetical protein
MKKIIFVSLVVFLSLTASAQAKIVEFNGKTAKFVSPKDSIKKPIVLGVKTKQNVVNYSAPAKSTSNKVTDSYLSSLIEQKIQELISQGVLVSASQINKTPDIQNYNPDGVGFQAVYMPTAVVASESSTFFASTNLSSNEFVSSSAEVEELKVSDELVAEGDAEIKGQATLASTTITSLEVNSITSPSGAQLTEAGDWVNASSKELKENFASVTPDTILEKLLNLPILAWNYKVQSAEHTHLGPMAEDFKEIFNLGDGKSISTVDSAGIALASIQALAQKIHNPNLLIPHLTKFGIELTESLVKVKNLQTENLTVGSPEKPTGITIYDRITKEPMCLVSENGEIKMLSGNCQNIENFQAPIENIQENVEVEVKPEQIANEIPAVETLQPTPDIDLNESVEIINE